MNRRFIDRARELELLQQRWASDRAELLVVYGRRRIGKTYLLSHFSSDLPAVYHASARLPETQQLAELGRAFGAHLGDDLLRENGFRDWDQLLRLLGSLERRTLVVLDEYPYLVESSPGLSSRVQRSWDHALAESPNLVLVLCGSSVAMMEQETLTADAPLHGRRTGQLRVEAMDVQAAAEFVPAWGEDDVVQAFAVLGGVPHYLAQLDDRDPFAANLRRLVLQLGAPLRDEVEFLLRQELREPRIYFGILAAIAGGRRRLSEIANVTGVPASSLGKYLGVLDQLGLVEREVPVTEARPEKSKKGLYRVVDHYTAFWFGHVLPNRDLLDSGRESDAEQAILRSLAATVPLVYEEICRGLVRGGLLDAATGRRWTRVGRWWDRQVEIDLVGLAGDGEGVLLGEAKWSTKAVGTNVLEHLEAAACRLPGDIAARPRHYVLFSRSGFTSALERRAANRPDLTLVKGLG